MKIKQVGGQKILMQSTNLKFLPQNHQNCDLDVSIKQPALSSSDTYFFSDHLSAPSSYDTFNIPLTFLSDFY